ncbi:type II toxin-antitoxin system RelE/ParE family toxin [Planctomicrobium sp. SH661]|uniref:type II toxin-antitoxin system RelE/ParE family toxin n=1 Tax=Planctomicrobium sp. SH661 TaxID=3448124 RepID=UPI003F5BE24D
MAQVNWTAPALADLASVAEFVATHSHANAVAIVEAAFQRADEREHFAEAGSIVPELNDPLIREVIVKDSFRLIYEIRQQQIFVVAFVHCSRQLGSRFLDIRSDDTQ